MSRDAALQLRHAERSLQVQKQYSVELTVCGAAQIKARHCEMTFVQDRENQNF